MTAIATTLPAHADASRTLACREAAFDAACAMMQAQTPAAQQALLTEARARVSEARAAEAAAYAAAVLPFPATDAFPRL